MTAPRRDLLLPRYFEELEAPGRTGYFLSDAVQTVIGPRDTWGREGAALPYYPTGVSTGTEAPFLIGGGPVNARGYFNHGDPIPATSRGSYLLEKLMYSEEWGSCSTVDGASCDITVPTKRLRLSSGSPATPWYRIRVCAVKRGAIDKYNCFFRVCVDASYEEAEKVVFFGDLDPKVRVLQGEISIVPPTYAAGLTGFRAYSTADGNNNLGDGVPWEYMTLEMTCPPGPTTNYDWSGYSFPFASLPCSNHNPWGPKCVGPTCPDIVILPGKEGEWYLTRARNVGNYDEEQGRQNYSHNELADIYLPKAGWLSIAMMDVEE